MTALVYGLAVAGAATVRRPAAAAATTSSPPTTPSTTPSGRSPPSSASSWSARPTTAELAALVGASRARRAGARACPRRTRCSPSPPRPGVPVVSELELAYEWEQERPGGPRPMLAVTGTDGKTTTTLLAGRRCSRAAGVRAVAAGNTDVPLVDALDLDVDVFVVECTQLPAGAGRERSAADAAAWLNLAPDHLNWHTVDGHLRGGQGADLRPAAPRRRRHRLRRRPGRDGHLAAAPGAPRDVRRAPAPTTTSPAADARSGRRAALARRSRRCAGRCPTTSPTRSPPRRSCSRPGWPAPDAVAAALADVRRAAAPHRARRRGRRACAGTTTPRPPRRTPRRSPSARFDRVVLHRRRAQQGPRPGADGRRARAHRAPSSRSARPPTLVAATFAGDRRRSSRADVDGRGRRARPATLAAPGDVVLLSPGCASFDWYPTAATRPAATTSDASCSTNGSERRLKTFDTTAASAALDGGRRPWRTGRRLGRRPPAPGAGAAARRRRADAQAAGPRRQGADTPTAGLWDVQRGPAPVAYYVIGVVVAVFVMLGLVMVLSASAGVEAAKGNSPYHIFNRQATWAAIGLGRA